MVSSGQLSKYTWNLPASSVALMTMTWTEKGAGIGEKTVRDNVFIQEVKGKINVKTAECK